MSRGLLAQLPSNPNHKCRIQGLALQRTSSLVPGSDAGFPSGATARPSSSLPIALGFGLKCAALRDSTFVIRACHRCFRHCSNQKITNKAAVERVSNPSTVEQPDW
jgi:hypothetical protein